MAIHLSHWLSLAADSEIPEQNRLGVPDRTSCRRVHADRREGLRPTAAPSGLATPRPASLIAIPLKELAPARLPMPRFSAPAQAPYWPAAEVGPAGPV